MYQHSILCMFQSVRTNMGDKKTLRSMGDQGESVSSSDII